MTSPAAPSTARTGGSRLADRRVLGLVAVTAAVVVAGLVWAKWSPYAARTLDLTGGAAWPGSPVLATGAGEGAITRAWEFTRAYTDAVWRALLVALVLSATVSVLVPRDLLLRALARRSPLGSSTAGALSSLPGMMCTCCTAPLVVTMRRVGAPTAAVVAFWLGNPVLNPAVLVFLAVLVPASWVVVRVALGVLLVVGVAALLGHLAERRAVLPTPAAGAPAPALDAARDALDDPALTAPLRALPQLWLRRFLLLSAVLVPEYLVVVFLVGLFAEPLGAALGGGGALAVLVAVAVGLVVVLPTGGEIPVLLGLAAAGASPAVLGVLLLALPAVSLPSAVMVGRALGWGTTAGTVAATGGVALLAGGALAVLS